MKKLLVLVGLAGLLCAQALQAAMYDGAVRITASRGTYGSGPGGEFTITVTSDLGGLVTIDGVFQSFCLETEEYISLGQSYNANVNDRAIQGRNGATGDPISVGTAWLYSHFRALDLATYNYTAGSGRNASANALQDAIWWLEVEGGARNDFINIAAAALGSPGVPLTDAEIRANAATGAYGVVVLNLYNSNGTVAQDQLALVPEPTTMIAGALLLLPFGVSTLRILRKKHTA